METLVVMSQPALTKYIADLLSGGTLLVDPDLIKKPPARDDITLIKIPAAKTADNIGRRIFENMVMLGALQARTGMISKESLFAAIKENVPPRTVESNLKAAQEGIRLAS